MVKESVNLLSAQALVCILGCMNQLPREKRTQIVSFAFAISGEQFRRRGATHIATLCVDGGLAPREGIETDLRRAIVTLCNDQ